jgi:hypothetical protein
VAQQGDEVSIPGHSEQQDIPCSRLLLHLHLLHRLSRTDSPGCHSRALPVAATATAAAAGCCSLQLHWALPATAGSSSANSSSASTDRDLAHVLLLLRLLLCCSSKPAG